MRTVFREILALSGTGSAFYGLYQVNEPSAFIVLGVFLVWVSAARSSKSSDESGNK